MSLIQKARTLIGKVLLNTSRVSKIVGKRWSLPEEKSAALRGYNFVRESILSERGGTKYATSSPNDLQTAEKAANMAYGASVVSHPLRVRNQVRDFWISLCC